MGLNFHNSDAQWSYSGFMEFRKRLWTLCGFEGDLREIYYGTSPVKLEVAKDHPLFDFFNHSDCDGKLTPRQLKVIVPALKEALPKMVAQNRPFDHDVQSLGALIETCEDCIKKKKSLIYC